jgi:hypothetical protein
VRTVSWVTWVFDGFGVAVPLAIISWFLVSKSSQRRARSRQSITSGANSTNVQIGGDFNIGEAGTSGREDASGKEGDAPGGEGKR